MMEKNRVSKSQSNDTDEDTSYDVEKTIRISSFASSLAWSFIVLASIIFLFGAYSLFKEFLQWPNSWRVTDYITVILAASFIILLCLFFAVQLLVASERTFILMDIQENTYLLRKENRLSIGPNDDEVKGAS
jgi:magnesium-transporting ATPase (P-type)